MAPQSPWSDLQQELLELIFDCTKDPIDILRCGAVCKSWRPAALQVYRKFFPLCLILTEKNVDNTGVFFNILTKETRKIHLPEARGRRICCCYNGWLLTVDDIGLPKEKKDIGLQYRLRLINIFSRKEIVLPPVTFLRSFNYPPSDDDKWIDQLMWKVFLSNCPSDSDCVIVIFLRHKSYESERHIFVCKPGDERWIDWGTWHCNFHDPILLNGNMYAGICKCIPPRLTKFYLQPSLNFITWERMVRHPEPFQRSYNCTFSVKSRNDVHLLLICYKGASPFGKIFDNYKFDVSTDGFRDSPYGEIFDIFEIDVSTAEIREVNDLGGCALFISPNGNHILAEVRNSETWYKVNCIYFFRHSKGDYFIYDLKTRHSKVVPCQWFTEDENYSRSLWVNPDA